VSRVNTTFEEGHLVLQIKERFTFDLLREFRGAYEPHMEAARQISIDLADVEYMDSSSLGMLLSLHNACSGRNIPCSLLNCNDTLREILEIVHFEQKFRIT